MSKRLIRVILVVAGIAFIPVILGASCPAPSGPRYLTPVRTGVVQPPVPDCDPGFVCISIVNRACITAQVALYTHDGYDDLVDPVYPCRETTQDNVVLVVCDEAEVGELQLTRPQLFTPVNQALILGQQLLPLLPETSVLVRLQCSSVKSMGIEVSAPGGTNVDDGDPTTPDEPTIDVLYTAGPDYRCPMVNLSSTTITFDSDVPCGETIQYLIRDINECVDPTLTNFTVDMTTSAACSLF